MRELSFSDFGENRAIGLISGQSNIKQAFFYFIAAALIFAVDIARLPGLGEGVPYFVLVLLGLWAPTTRYLCALAVIATMLAVAGHFFAGGDVGWSVFSDRALAFATIWSTAIAIAVHKHHLQTLATSRLDLERTVEQRTVEIRDSEDKFRNITDSLPVLIAYIDRDQYFRSANKLFETWYQTSVSNIIGRRMSDILTPEGYDELKGAIEQVLAGEAALREHEGMMPDGVYRYVRIHYLPHKTDDGDIPGFFALAEDITDIRQATRALERQGARLAEAQRIGNIGNWERNFVSGELYWSDQTRVIFGWSEPDASGLTREDFISIVHEDDRAFVQDALRRAIEENAPYSLDHRIVLKDGSVRVVHEEAIVNRDPDGQALRIAGTVQDITERKRIEATNFRFLNAIDHVLGSIALYDADEGLVTCNVRYRQLSGAVGGKLLPGLKFEDYLRLLVEHGEVPEAEDDPERWIAGRLERFRNPGEVYEMLRGGHHFQIAEARLPDGGTVISTIDITEQRATEELLRRSQKMEAIGQLTGGIAHDFNNILAAIMGNLTLLQESSNDADDGNIGLIVSSVRAADRGAELTHRLLAFSRQQALDAKLMDINGMLPQFHQLASSVIGEEIKIELALEPDLWATMVDAGQLENALLNLAINARDAMPKGGRLKIKTGNQVLREQDSVTFGDMLPGNYAVITVSDNGTGMSKDILQQVFEPFFTTKEFGKGSGLGLSMVFGFAKQSGGHVAIESTEGQGTAVSIFLPKTDMVLSEPRHEVETEHKRPTGNETVLVVEDDIEIGRLLSRALGRLGYRVLQAEDGPAALATMSAADEIDLLLTDVILPNGMNGRDVAENFRKIHPAAAVLYSSGYTREILSERGQLEDGTVLLSKPYQIQDLAQRVRDVLDNRL